MLCPRGCGAEGEAKTHTVQHTSAWLMFAFYPIHWRHAIKLTGSFNEVMGDPGQLSFSHKQKSSILWATFYPFEMVMHFNPFQPGFHATRSHLCDRTPENKRTSSTQHCLPPCTPAPHSAPFCPQVNIFSFFSTLLWHLSPSCDEVAIEAYYQL